MSQHAIRHAVRTASISRWGGRVWSFSILLTKTPWWFDYAQKQSKTININQWPYYVLSLITIKATTGFHIAMTWPGMKPTVSLTGDRVLFGISTRFFFHDQVVKGYWLADVCSSKSRYPRFEAKLLVETGIHHEFRWTVTSFRILPGAMPLQMLLQYCRRVARTGAVLEMFSFTIFHWHLNKESLFIVVPRVCRSLLQFAQAVN